MSETKTRSENSRKIKCYYDKDDILPPILAKIKRLSHESISSFIVKAIIEKARKDRILTEN